MDGGYFELPLDDPNEPNVISSFDRRGEYILCGNGKGKVIYFNRIKLWDWSAYLIGENGI